MGWDNKIQQNVYRHAKEDMAAAAGMAQMRPDAEPATFWEWIKANHAKQPSLGSEIKAIVREAIKDVRQTVNEVFFGKGEHAPEPGAPLNPTPQVITADMGNVYGVAMEQAQTMDIMKQQGYQPPEYNPEEAAQRSKGREHELSR